MPSNQRSKLVFTSSITRHCHRWLSPVINLCLLPNFVIFALRPNRLLRFTIYCHVFLLAVANCYLLSYLALLYFSLPSIIAYHCHLLLHIIAIYYSISLPSIVSYNHHTILLLFTNSSSDGAVRGLGSTKEALFYK